MNRLLDLPADALRGKRVLVRAGFDVPLDAHGEVGELFRIERALPTLVRLREAGAKTIILSHIGRDPEESNEPVAKALARRIPVTFIPDLLGALAHDAINAMREGDIVLLENLRRDPRETKNDDTFAKDNIHYQIYQPEIKVVEEGGRSFFGFLYQIKNYFLDRLNQLIPEPAAALLGGLLVGAKRSLGAEWLEIFRRAGVIHIVVLSGYNLTIIAAAVLALGRRLPKRLAILLAGLVIILFTLMTGAGAASVRAAIMAVIALYALAAGRSYEVGWALFLSFTLMLVYNPRLLLYDPGFQLSFLATAGLVYFSPVVAPWFKRWPARFGFREIVTSTLATQAFVLPWLIYQTGQLSLVSLLSNLLVLPVIPLTMLTGFLAGSLALLSPLLATPLVYLAYLPLSYILKTTQFLAGLPLAVVTINFFPAWLILLIYLGFSFWLGRFYARASSNAQT
jgi:competence protein ComEC